MPYASPTVLAVALGGALGSLLRYAVELALPAPSGAVPWGTLTVNVVGSAWLAAAGVRRLRVRP